MSMDLSTIQMIFLSMIALLNFYSYGLFYTDKKRAVNGKRNRISEKKLLLTSFMGGGLGSLLAMSVVRHKTKHTRFRVLIPLAAMFTVGILYFIWHL